MKYDMSIKVKAKKYGFTKRRTATLHGTRAPTTRFPHAPQLSSSALQSSAQRPPLGHGTRRELEADATAIGRRACNRRLELVNEIVCSRAVLHPKSRGERLGRLCGGGRGPADRRLGCNGQRRGLGRAARAGAEQRHCERRETGTLRRLERRVVRRGERVAPRGRLELAIHGRHLRDVEQGRLPTVRAHGQRRRWEGRPGMGSGRQRLGTAWMIEP
mmetsp:Transcript_7795/g.18565  ORF Transcript_7795/g.18565 Transcript_7795/m.18565 type:complete len:216 (+) Transcript_7795:34-681(+)